MDEQAGLELEELDQLLKILKNNGVHSFQGAGITVVFNESEGIAPTALSTMVPDDGHSTSNKRVSGFSDPVLWKHQNGKHYNFKGELE